MVRALDLLGQAIERDPQYGPALVWRLIVTKGSS
jgi:hypothetical protein